MHIPDGYLSPQTYLPLYAATIALISVAIKKIKRVMSVKLVPYLGMASAFSFIIMMFNIPIPGGTTGHATGAALIALVLGPWVAVVSVSVALILQAFIFGDGGITAIGANCFNIAVVIPFVSYAVFKLVSGKISSPARLNLAAFLAGYVGLCMGAVVTGVEFGIQPLIASAGGQALYSPYPLEVAVPVMALEHLLIFGIVEGVVTMFVFKYFYKNNLEMVEVLKGSNVRLTEKV